ncbi:MAG: acyl carrier protein [Candidatus Thorarchaeota archaeon]|jgi:acyl carrier protein|nr:acyl carrier protein [Candidatus Thorarchaeota archaeon]
MTDAEDALAEIISKALLLEIDELTDDLKRGDYEPWDSMAHLVLISEIENKFGIIFEDDEVVDIWTVADIRSLLSKKISS